MVGFVHPTVPSNARERFARSPHCIHTAYLAMLLVVLVHTCKPGGWVAGEIHRPGSFPIGDNVRSNSWRLRLWDRTFYIVPCLRATSDLELCRVLEVPGSEARCVPRVPLHGHSLHGSNRRSTSFVPVLRSEAAIWVRLVSLLPTAWTVAASGTALCFWMGATARGCSPFSFGNACVCRYVRPSRVCLPRVSDHLDAMTRPRFHPAGEWDQLGDEGKVFFRKHLVYEAEWSYVEFDNYKVVCASHGGPIALFRDVEKPMLLGAGTMPLSAVHIFSSSGEKRCIINISKMEGMAGLFWTTGLELLCVLDHGYVQRYNIAGDIITDGGFFLGSVAKEQKVVQVYGGKNALVARTSKNRFVMVKDVADPMAKVLPHTELLQDIACVQLLETTDGYATRVELMVAVGNSVVVIDEYGAEDQLLNLPNPIESMSVSPNGQLLAVLDTEGWIRVLSTDLTKHLSAFETGVTRGPRQMAWCGLDAVLLDCMDSLLLIGPYGDSIRYPYEDLVFLKQEIDGARLFSSSKVEFIGRVPTASQSIFQIGSVAPGALLYDAKRYFDEKSIKADENMREIGEENLPVAIKHCIEAGLSEWEPTEQQTLLQAAAYGLAYYKSKSLDPNILKDACQSLRVLNAIREADIGFLITYPQLVQLGMPRILTWLAKSRQHLLALRIAQMIGSGAQDVVLDWALSKIRSEISNGLSDDVLYEALFPKLKSCVGIPIAHIAQYAHTSGRPKLATRILEIESSPSQYVPLYLKLGEDIRALEKSIDSGDEDLIYLCLFHMLKNWQLKDFLKVIVDHPHARDLFIFHCRTNEPELLETTYLYMNKPEGIADACVEQALSRNSGQTLPRSPLPATPQLMERAAKAFTQNKSCLVESKTAEDAAKLLRQQTDLENALSGVALKGLSLSMTISQLLIVGHEKSALRLKSDFRLSERAFLTIKAASLAETKNWEQLLVLARNKRLPLPHDYLVNLAANSSNGGAPRQVLEGLIQCIPDPRQRAELFTQYNFKSEAEALLQQDKDNEFITRLFAKMGT